MGFVAGFIDSIAGGGGMISIPVISLTGMHISLVLCTNKLQSAQCLCMSTTRVG